ERKFGADIGLLPLRRDSNGRGPARSVVTRSRFANSFVRAMASDFEQYGVSAIKRVRSQYPAIYLKICAMMLPKEIQVKEDAISRLSDEQLRRISKLRSRLGGGEAGGAAAARRTD